MLRHGGDTRPSAELSLFSHSLLLWHYIISRKRGQEKQRFLKNRNTLYPGWDSAVTVAQTESSPTEAYHPRSAPYSTPQQHTNALPTCCIWTLSLWCARGTSSGKTGSHNRRAFEASANYPTQVLEFNRCYRPASCSGNDPRCRPAHYTRLNGLEINKVIGIGVRITLIIVEGLLSLIDLVVLVSRSCQT